MEIVQIDHNKKNFLELLLLADPEEQMIDRYLERGALFALYDNGLKSICVVTEEAGFCELKNLATCENAQGQGYGSALVEYVCRLYRRRYSTMLVGTGNSPKTLGFYEKCGFRFSHIVKNFFLDNYQQPIYEEGVLLCDMVYLSRAL